MYYRDEFLRITNDMRNRREDLIEELKTLPEGELCSRVKNERTFFYNRLKKEGNRKKERRIGLNKDPQMLKLLVRKKYVEDAIDCLESNIKNAETLIGKIRPADENSVMRGFLDNYPELEDGIYRTEALMDEWASSHGTQSDYHRENLTSTALDGSMRRSKGEILIGAKLDHYKIPYRYEAVVHPDLSYIPDFTIKRPRDGKLIFWEHLGMVNDKKYMDGNRRKFQVYEDEGIVPWDNLIVTYDQTDGGINEKLIDAMIQGWLL